MILGSFLPWFGILALPWISLSIAQKAIAGSVLFVIAEVLFWVGVLIVGKEVADRYQRWLNPRFVWQQLRQWWQRVRGR